MRIEIIKTGYSLVEVLVSISILLIATVGPMAIATQGLKSSQFALEQNTAYFLAQEGIEAIFAIRNNYALVDIHDGLGTGDPDTSWDWVVGSGVLLNSSAGPCMPGQYRLNTDGKSCSVGVVFNGGSHNDVSLVNCNRNNVGNCRIYYNERDNRAVYSHDSGGEETPFTRVVTITRESDYSVKVESKVTWDSNVFQGERSVTETTYLFDSNFESS